MAKLILSIVWTLGHVDFVACRLPTSLNYPLYLGALQPLVASHEKDGGQSASRWLALGLAGLVTDLILVKNAPCAAFNSVCLG